MTSEDRTVSLVPPTVDQVTRTAHAPRRSGRIRARRWASRLLPFAVLIAMLGSWDLALRMFNIPSYLLPTPGAVVDAFASDPRQILDDTYYTTLEAVMGFLLALVGGMATGIVIAFSATARRIIYPYLVAIQVTPIVAIAPILVLWFGFGLMPKVAVAFLIAYFPIAINIGVGLRSPDRELINLMRSFAVSELTIFRKVRLPYSLPYLFAGVRISAPATVIGAIVGEFVSSDRGLGFVILQAKASLDTAMLFLAIIAAALLGLSMFAVTTLLERRYLYWHESQSGEP